MSGHVVGSISKLHQDAQFINQESIEWNKLVATVYEAINSLTSTWEGEARSEYVTKVNDAQPELVGIANLMNGLAANLESVSNMYKITEEGGDPRQAEIIDPKKFSLTDMVSGVGGNDSSFDSNECESKSSEIIDAATKLSSILENVRSSIDSINSNYTSDFGIQLKRYLDGTSEKCEEHIRAIKAFGNYLVDVVAPKYSYIDSAIDEMNSNSNI